MDRVAVEAVVLGGHTVGGLRWCCKSSRRLAIRVAEVHVFLQGRNLPIFFARCDRDHCAHERAGSLSALNSGRRVIAIM